MAVRRTLFVLIGGMLLLPIRSECGEVFSLFESLRSKTMGGAHLVTADDELAVYSNPAGVAKVRNPRGSFDTAYELSTSVVDPMVNIIANMTDSSVEKNPLTAVSNSWGEYHYFSIAATPHFVAQNFSLQVLWRHQTGFIQTDASTLEMHRRIDTGLIAGFGFPLFGGVVKIGGMGKMIHRAEANTISTDGTTFESYSFANNLQEGFGFGADAGVTLTAPIRFFPAISGVVRNLGGMKFGTHYGFWSDTSGTRPRPQEEEMSYDVGYGMVFRIGRDSWVHVEADMRDVMGYLDDKKTGGFTNSLLRHFHAGLEISFDRMFFVRAGAYQGYPSVGVGIVTRVFALEAGFYGVETGTVTNRRASYRGLMRLEFGY